MNRYTYVSGEGVSLFTVTLLPEDEERCPVLLIRDPYVDETETMTEEEAVARYAARYEAFVQAGYGVVFQQCRGRGKSTGDCIPYIHEREDGLRLQAWVRQQPFYNGQLLLYGVSYLSSAHFATAPFAPDIVGAVFHVQDCERYNIAYRNGCFKIGLHGNWYFGMYKRKTLKTPRNNAYSFDTLPLTEFSRGLLGEPAADLDEMLRHPEREDAFWSTRWGGADARDALRTAQIPVLLTTGFYDIYTGGIFDMWRSLPPETRQRSALLVSAYDHPDQPDPQGIVFPDGSKQEHFGAHYEIPWLDYVLGRRDAPVATGCVTYYELFRNRWRTDAFAPGTPLAVPLGEGTRTYTYDPADPPSFRGGLSCNFGGSVFQAPPGERQDILTVYTAPFAQDTAVRGRMTARLTVASDCEDTGFYVRVSIEKPEGDFGLRDDITTLCRQHPDYMPGQAAQLTFTFDEHAFWIRQGERLRVDVASADRAHYVRHTNEKGLFSTRTTCRVAHNTVFFDRSSLTVPVAEG